jgi:hypothetical protein
MQDPDIGNPDGQVDLIEIFKQRNRKIPGQAGQLFEARDIALAFTVDKGNDLFSNRQLFLQSRNIGANRRAELVLVG